MGGHVFLDYMSFRMTCQCLMRAFILRVVIICRRKYHVGRWTCIGAYLHDDIS